MIKVKTSELQEAALDYAVAEIENRLEVLVAPARLKEVMKGYSPSTDWSQGGPIIEREEIDLEKASGNYWVATFHDFYGDCRSQEQGATPLIAAMRCYVASKLGDVVDIPEELIQK